MSDFIKIKVGYNEYGFNSTIAEQNNIKTNIQSIFNEIIALNLGIILAENDPKELFDDPKAYFCNKMVTETMSINGLELDKAKVFDLMKKPDELNILVEKILNIKKNGSDTAQDRFFFMHAHNFTIVDNTVILKQSVIDGITELYSIYLNTQKQKDINDSLEIIILNLLAIKTLEPSFVFDTLFSKLLNANDSKKTVEINYRQLQSY